MGEPLLALVDKHHRSGAGQSAEPCRELTDESCPQDYDRLSQGDLSLTDTVEGDLGERQKRRLLRANSSRYSLSARHGDQGILSMRGVTRQEVAGRHPLHTGADRFHL